MRYSAYTTIVPIAFWAMLGGERNFHKSKKHVFTTIFSPESHENCIVLQCQGRNLRFRCLFLKHIYTGTQVSANIHREVKFADVSSADTMVPLHLFGIKEASTFLNLFLFKDECQT